MSSRALPMRLVQLACLAVFLAAAGWAWTLALPTLVQRGCWLGEWPFEQGCPDWPTSKDPQAKAEVFIEHLQHNVGDGRAYARLAGILWTNQDPRLAAALPHVRQLAPYHPTVLGVTANSAVAAQDWPTAAQALTTMVDRNQPEAVKPLVDLMVYPATQEAVLAQVQPGRRWLDVALANLSPQVPPMQVQAFVAKGTEVGILNPQTALAMVDRLKNSGDWIDAYTLWVGSRGKVPEGLFNGGFDQRSIRRGFDWEWPDLPPSGNRGMRVLQVSASPRRGSMLEIEMSGRAALPQPMVSQVVMMPSARYRFRGSYMSDRVQTVDGLVWALRCANGGERFAQTAPIRDTQRKWQTFDLSLTVPPTCGGSARLQLEAASPGEARAGMAGIVAFDDFELKATDAEGTGG